MIPVNSYLNLNIYRQDYDLPAFPLIIIIFILMMLPISFLWAAPASLIAFISAILTLDHSKMETQVYFFYIIFFIFLVYDKWRGEISTRNDYSQNVTIEDTRLLMYETLKGTLVKHSLIKFYLKKESFPVKLNGLALPLPIYHLILQL